LRKRSFHPENEKLMDFTRTSMISRKQKRKSLMRKKRKKK